MTAETPDAPESPDPQEVANAQRVNVNSPFGSIEFSAAPSTGPTEEEIQAFQEQVSIGGASFSDLPPGKQAELTQRFIEENTSRGFPSAEISMDPRLEQEARRRFGALSESDLGIPSDRSGLINEVEQAEFDRLTRLLEPQFNEREEDLRQSLADRGLPSGSEAFNDELNRLDRTRNQAFAQAADRAVGAGRTEAQRLFRNEMGREQFNLQSALGLSGRQVPNFGAGDALGAAQLGFQGELADFNAQSQQAAAKNQGQTQALSTAAMLAFA